MNIFIFVVGPLQLVSYPSVQGYRYRVKLLAKMKEETSKINQQIGGTVYAPPQNFNSD